jgi:tRNA uridine 5-carboxymethylaminomethyl modification enzyme
MSQQQFFNVIVIGGGHAGVEAAHAAARMGSRTALVTLDKNKTGLMPCNPSIGGVGKGHIVFEISALDGVMPKLCNTTYLQAHMLNTKKGPAVQGLRLQIDKDAYREAASHLMQNTPNLTVIEAMVDEIIVENGVVRGIITAQQETILCNQVVITTGTFLNGLIHIGEVQHSAGRSNEKASIELADFLAKLHLRMGRLKTGTPPRLATDSIDFEKLEKQVTSPVPYLFDFFPQTIENTVACHIAYTNEESHRIIKENLHRSAMYSGNIKGIGPRYCPSIEDKIARFFDKKAHHIFVEPETKEFVEAYPSGVSTSLPVDVQNDFIHSIRGFENAKIVKPGYAIEYDFVHPDQLKHSLEVISISGLFLAGQVNGTTGYEEAAGQGLVAGINAHLKDTNQPPFILDRSESYIGVMIDDLVRLGVDEPYRMFTSRAERRLVLRQDNSFRRLTARGYAIGVVSQALYDAFMQEEAEYNQAIDYLNKTYKHTQLIQALEKHETNSQEMIQELVPFALSPRNTVSVYAHVKYKDYIIREERQIETVKKYQQISLPEESVIEKAPSLSIEIKQKLKRHKPKTIAEAQLIPGITPAALSMLILLAKHPSIVDKYDSNK